LKRKDQKRLFKLIPHKEAFHRLKEALRIKPLDCEEIALNKALGRVLAAEVVAETDIPRENHAVFDGYAVQSTETKNASTRIPVVFRIVSETFPGEPPKEIFSDQTIYVACGGHLPTGADAIVKVENTRLQKEKIEVCLPIEHNENVALAGEDVKCGDLIFGAGNLLRPQDVGLLAGLGLKKVKVFRKPKVGIISVGDELVSLSEKEPYKIVNNYALIVSLLVSEFGGDPKLFGIVPDDLNQIKKRISEATKETDIVATIAGCSVGKRDLVPDAIKALDDPGIVFHGIKLSPGRVAGAGVVKSKPVIMLPGHIVSTYAGFYSLLAPLIAEFSGLDAEAYFPVFEARITKDVKAKPLANFLRVHLTYVDGESRATPSRGGASTLTNIVNSNGFTIVPRGKGLKKGSHVNVVLYNRYEFAHLS
jgi:molybdopterin molybdotransferase